MNDFNKENNLLTRGQAAKYLGVKANTLAVWACTKRYNLAFVRIGRLCKYRLSDLEAFIAHNVTCQEVTL